MRRGFYFASALLLTGSLPGQVHRVPDDADFFPVSVT